MLPRALTTSTTPTPHKDAHRVYKTTRIITTNRAVCIAPLEALAKERLAD
jgi:hypothetical protein